MVSSKKLLSRGLFHLQGTNKGSPRLLPTNDMVRGVGKRSLLSDVAAT